MSVILSWNKYIEYLKETFAKNMEPLGFEEWSIGAKILE